MYVILWEFEVKESHRIEFEQAYGQGGEWAELFKHGEGYVGTELLQDITNPNRYVTIDRWVSAVAYHAFQAQWHEAYQTIDAHCEGLTERETLLGTFIHDSRDN